MLDLSDCQRPLDVMSMDDLRERIAAQDLEACLTDSDRVELANQIRHLRLVMIYGHDGVHEKLERHRLTFIHDRAQQRKQEADDEQH